ncbi:hypothetical protein ABZ470_20335 [Streptosporangium sp. NPDC020072]|uniref:hypothetical protein n=1 Tax=Streptosporangium sp. NPDC020072 TaxID=3154788 RepID=UPI003443C15C
MTRALNVNRLSPGFNEVGLLPFRDRKPILARENLMISPRLVWTMRAARAGSPWSCRDTVSVVSGTGNGHAGKWAAPFGG